MNKTANLNQEIENDLLFHAVKKGDNEAIKQHLADGADVNAKVDFVSTPLHYAAEEGHMEIVQLLIDAGANVNVKNNDGGWTPLHLASCRLDENGRRREIVDLLITEGADVNVKNEGGGTPLMYAAERGHKEIVDLLIAKGADVNARSGCGETPLNWSKRETADLLRKHGGKTKKELEAAEQ